MCQSPWAAIKSYHRLSGLNNGNLFPHSSGGWTLEIRCRQCWFLPRPPSLACRWLSSPCVLTWSFFCVCLCRDLLFLEGHQSYRIRASHMTSFYLHHLILPSSHFITCLQIQSHSEVLRVRIATTHFEGTQFSP